MSDSMRSYIVILALLVMVMASAIAGVYTKHQSRKLFTEFQALTTERDKMEVEWGRLQLEQSTRSTYALVEQAAREQMKMYEPPPKQVSLLAE